MNTEFIFSVLCMGGLMFVLALVRYLTSQNNMNAKDEHINLTKSVKKTKTTKFTSTDDLSNNDESISFFSWGGGYDGSSNDGGSSDGGGGGD